MTRIGVPEALDEAMDGLGATKVLVGADSSEYSLDVDERHPGVVVDVDASTHPVRRARQ